MVRLHSPLILSEVEGLKTFKMEHKPVMSVEVSESLNLRPGCVVLDCTIGTGGHSELILKKIMPKGRLIGVDRDKESLDYSRQRLASFTDAVTLVHNNFRNIGDILNTAGVDKVDAMLFDLGISSYQLDTPERGFSIKNDAPLDMRMDQSSYISAYDLVNNLTEDEISSIIKTFGQERWHNRIARYMVSARNAQPIATTGQLSSIIIRAIPKGFNRSRIHPATRTFQALRIAVNRELESIEEALRKSLDYLNIGGRISVISFHSLEDKIAKNTFKRFVKEARAKLIQAKSGISDIRAKPEIASPEEIEDNPRSRSAKLRTIERLE